MPKTYTITPSEAKQIQHYREEIVDKQVDKRLRAVQLRSEGKKNQAIAEMLETSSDMVSRWISTYAKEGIEGLLPKKRTATRWNLSFSEEAALLSGFSEQGEAGQIVEVSEIKRVYEERVGHRIGSGQIYRVLKRHKWRKIKPRSKHPKKASEEEIASSKKLTNATSN